MFAENSPMPCSTIENSPLQYSSNSMPRKQSSSTADDSPNNMPRKTNDSPNSNQEMPRSGKRSRQDDDSQSPCKKKTILAHLLQLLLLIDPPPRDPGLTSVARRQPVCAKHFPENQFLTVREAFNTSTGELIQVPMECKRFVPDTSQAPKEKDKIVTLLLDEVHIKEYFEYKGGCVTGMLCDSEASASSAQVFMVKNIASQYKDVHVLPVHSISGKMLHETNCKNVLVKKKVK
ncbi:hypothetical protein HNY73_007339 [Argiope bruennichi]|uniref:Uncharacterized protein n=1 Tax=Argiope bruennichi TaxID=94029 RepID=A0A8T0FIP3_ARGBR|nr:hypothetical protein HNY73_007339 [Argiope bruennichi]